CLFLKPSLIVQQFIFVHQIIILNIKGFTIDYPIILFQNFILIRIVNFIQICLPQVAGEVGIWMGID
ncbi:unnamed protein product, partial [Brassica oleracea var. botrytis]